MFVGLGQPLLVALNAECGCRACEIGVLAGVLAFFERLGLFLKMLSLCPGAGACAG
jgi:hypothetical protein